MHVVVDLAGRSFGEGERNEKSEYKQDGQTNKLGVVRFTYSSVLLFIGKLE
jgi:hypothetical protein